MQLKTQRALDWLGKLPRAQLGFFPTPLQHLERMSKYLGIDLYIKRDDFTGNNLFGGNKVRKLEYLLGQAVARGTTHAVTYGATQSNHAMETAAACRRLGIQPILYLTAVVSPKPEDLRANYLLDHIFGAEIHIVPIEPGETEADAEERSFRMGAQRSAELNASGHPCVDIPMGGANALGSVGFAAAMIELQAQCEAMNGLHFSQIYHATGTGGTMAGLHAGRAMLDQDVQIVSVAASPKDEARYIEKIHGLCCAVLEQIGIDVKPNRHAMHVDLSQWQPGYEQPSAAASEAIRLLAHMEGLLVDPVYTGKALAGLLADVRNGIIKRGEKVLFWHTGGATALFAEPEILGNIV
ncbi:MAG: D-cysteine desulfhydrase family protein [bacterium]